jgi:hypothetical protein
MQISEISASALGGLRGLGLSLGQDADVAERAAAADRTLVSETAAPEAPAAAPTFDLTPSILKAAGESSLTGRKLTLDLNTPAIAAAVADPKQAAKVAAVVKKSKGKVKVTARAAKALVKSVAKASPKAAVVAAKAIAPAVAKPAEAAPADIVPAASSTSAQATLVENPMKKWLLWGGIGVVALGAAFLFLRRRRATVAVAPVQTQGLGRYDGHKSSKKKSKKKSKK